MAKVSNHARPDDDQMELPPGFRFHPTDEELITHYLSPKVLDSSFCARAIGEVELNKVEPWDLPCKEKMGEGEWYFFCVRDRKYPSGLRTNRATDAGYWKATGKDREIFKGGKLVGIKKTLVFYRGRAPKGEKTNWVMHEYRLEAKNSTQNLIKTTKIDWVICRIFRKFSGEKKTVIPDLVRLSNYCHSDQFQSIPTLPPLMDLSPCDGFTRTTSADTSHVTRFSKPMDEHKSQKNMVDESLLSSHKPSDCVSNSSLSFPKISSAGSSSFATQLDPYVGNIESTDSVLMQDQSLLRLLLEKNSYKAELSQDTAMSSYEDQEYNIISSGNVDLDCIWNFEFEGEE